MLLILITNQILVTATAPKKSMIAAALKRPTAFAIFPAPGPLSRHAVAILSAVACSSIPSSDPDPEPAKREIDADMEIAQRKARDASFVRRGGMLRRPGQPERAPVAKRDLGLKKLFGRR
jgi:hypothetical protein